LAKLLALFKVRLIYVSPKELEMPPELVKALDERGVRQESHTALEAVLPETDVLYVTRIQQERFADPQEYERLKDSYIITPEVLRAAKPDLTLMHPLPRVGEISMAVDSDPRAAYFRQVEYGLFVRMALLALVLGKA
jgi:carbamoyl-phosphate synthase/aspartate carbamoyltransferase/dihydroorotase